MDTIQGYYYELPEDVVLVPFHSMAARNVGHLMWDDHHPLFTLLSLFGIIPEAASEDKCVCRQYQDLSCVGYLTVNITPVRYLAEEGLCLP